NGCLRGKRVGSSGHATADAAIVVSNEHAPLLVNRGVEEVEQIAAGPRTADSTALDRIAWRDVLSGPSYTAVKSRGDIKEPNTGEAGLIVIAATGLGSV